MGDNVKVYKSSLFVKIKNVIYGIFGGGALTFIASWFVSLEIAIIIGVAGFLLMAYFALIGDNIRVIVDGDFFSVYRGKKEKHRFNWKEVGIHANIKTTDGDSDCKLTVEDPDGETTYIDCSMLGASRFYKLLDAIGVTDAKPVAVETIKKGGK